MNDPFVGNLTFFRVYSGVLEAGTSLQRQQGPQGAHRPPAADARQQARGHQRSPHAATSARRWASRTSLTGDTLCDEDQPVILEKMDFPEPVIQVAIEPKTKADQEKLGVALSGWPRRTPPSRCSTDAETGQTIIAGMGELHLEIIVDRMMREFKVDANVGKPRWPTARPSASGWRPKASTSARPAAAASTATSGSISSPTRPGKGYEFVNEIKGGAVPKEYIKPVDQGIQEAMDPASWPATRWWTSRSPSSTAATTRWTPAKWPSRSPASMAFKAGCEKAGPVLLEPIMAVEVVVPEEYMGDVIGNLNSRRGRIENMEDRAGVKVVTARVPLAEMFAYSTSLRGMTQGRANYTMQFSHYDEAPKNVGEEIVAKVRGTK